MARNRSRLPWRYDEERQEFTTPTGVVSLHELAALRYGIATSHVDLHGPWTGWRIRGALLKGPNGVSMRVRPETAAQFARWIRENESAQEAAAGKRRQRPILYLVKD